MDRKKFEKWKTNAIHKWGSLPVESYWEKLYSVAYNDGARMEIEELEKKIAQLRAKLRDYRMVLRKELNK